MRNISGIGIKWKRFAFGKEVKRSTRLQLNSSFLFSPKNFWISKLHSQRNKHSKMEKKGEVGRNWKGAFKMEEKKEERKGEEGTIQTLMIESSESSLQMLSSLNDSKKEEVEKILWKKIKREKGEKELGKEKEIKKRVKGKEAKEEKSKNKTKNKKVSKEDGDKGLKKEDGDKGVERVDIDKGVERLDGDKGVEKVNIDKGVEKVDGDKGLKKVDVDNELEEFLYECHKKESKGGEVMRRILESSFFLYAQSEKEEGGEKLSGLMCEEFSEKGYLPVFTSHQRLEQFVEWSEREDIGEWEPRYFSAENIIAFALKLEAGVAINCASSYPILLEPEALRSLQSVQVEPSYAGEEAEYKEGEEYYEGKVGFNFPNSLSSSLKSTCNSFRSIIKRAFVQQRVSLNAQCQPDLVIGIEYTSLATPTDKENFVRMIGKQVLPKLNVIELNGRGVCMLEWIKSEQDLNNWIQVYP